MVLGSELAMPIIVLNMGGEMIYILHQRLQAQQVPEEKSRKVLEDVVRTMYTPMFLDELFKPQEVYTASATKQIFEKLAHSSIMRLNKTSMDKLYDLMTMGVKHQIITSKSPQQFLQTTLNHLDSVIDMVKSESVTSLVQIAISKTIQTYSPLSTGNWMLLEQVIFSFYQGKKIKVSLFLQQNLQTVNGVLILSNNGSLPYGTERPGVIRYYEEHRLLRSDGFSTELADVCYESADVMDSSSRLGMNMYSKHPGPEQSGADAKFTPSSASKEAARLVNNAVEREIAAVTSPSHASPKRTALLSSAAGEKGSPSFRPTTQSTAKAELTLLSDLLGISSDSKADSKTEHSKFKINLFPNRAFHDSCAKAAAGGGDTDADDEDDDYAGDGSSGILILDIDATAGSKSIEDYMSALDLKDTGRGADMKAGAKGGNDDDDDLLALMDSAK